MPAKSFEFDANKTFADNFELFLEELELVDKEMALILRANAGVLEKVVRNGERDFNARASFNTGVAMALDALAASPASNEA